MDKYKLAWFILKHSVDEESEGHIESMQVPNWSWFWMDNIKESLGLDEEWDGKTCACGCPIPDSEGMCIECTKV